MLISRGSRVRRYEITAPLGAGGMGEVFLARDVELDRTVALKVLSDAPDDDGERNRRFVQEARAAIALNHPNVAHVYDVGEESGVRFMAMEYVEGETLRAHLARERMTLSEALEIGVQIASALASAHAHGIVHRDIKPENVMIRPDGYVKVLDFGLAKLTARLGTPDSPTMAVHTAPGLVMGTMQYMSPEQLRTDDVDARSDVFSLGVVLYEMITGKRPFEASTPSGVIAAILTDEPPPLDAALPPSVRAMVMKALAKKREDRYPSAKELAEALKSASHETDRIRSGDVPTQVLSHTTIAARRFNWKRTAILTAIAAVIALAAYFTAQARLVREARAKLPQIQKLSEERKYFEAWDLAAIVSPRLGDDPELARVMEQISAHVDVKTEPAGAQVFLERVDSDGNTQPRQLAGTTPLRKHGVALGDYVIRVEKSGYAPVTRTISLAPIAHPAGWVPQRPPELNWKLVPIKDAPPRMVKVRGGRYRIAAWGRPTNDTAMLDDFFIDQFEVTNREFKQFIDAGGYERRELWKHPFVKDGRSLAFDEVIPELKDTTGLNAPRRWVNQSYPEGRDDYPVTDVTWYEAAAYAEFRGKTLPTVFQWDKAARNGTISPFGVLYPWGVVSLGYDVARRANFRGAGPMPVASLPSGMSALGAYHMAGNVAEWCLNAYGDNSATVTGGDFNSPTYSFGSFGSIPTMHSSPTIGFRCARVTGPAKGDQGAMFIPFNTQGWEFSPVSDSEFAKIARVYDYPAAPLNARVVERKSTDTWTREKIEFDGADGQRAAVFLYLPRHAKPPYQVVHFVPASDVETGFRTLDSAMESTLAPVLRGGRAAFGVVLRGYIGRRTGNLEYHASSTPEYGERIVERVTDLRRGLDYLVTRPEIDKDRIAFLGPSAGASLGLIVAALEKRYRSIGVVGLGVDADDLETIAYANRINFAPRITAPKLMMHGRWDEWHPLQTEAMPIFRLFPEPKRLVVVDSGHIAPPDIFMRVFVNWFDESLGKVQR